MPLGPAGFQKTPNSLISLLENQENLPKDADLIIIWHGTNDWYWGAPLGDIDSLDDSTFMVL